MIAVALGFSWIVPDVALAHENTSISTDNNITVDYTEFYSNRAYYDELLKQGYGITIPVSEEYADIEISRITGSASAINESYGAAQSRGTSVPSDKNIHDIHADSWYIIRTDSDFQRIYTDKQIKGCTTYQLYIFNENYDNDLVITIYGTKSGNLNYSVSPRSVHYKYFATNTEDDQIFAAFNAPCYSTGNISCVAH